MTLSLRASLFSLFIGLLGGLSALQVHAQAPQALDEALQRVARSLGAVPAVAARFAVSTDKRPTLELALDHLIEQAASSIPACSCRDMLRQLVQVEAERLVPKALCEGYFKSHPEVAAGRVSAPH